MSDKDAVDEIRDMLYGKEWDADTQPCSERTSGRAVTLAPGERSAKRLRVVNGLTYSIVLGGGVARRELFDSCRYIARDLHASSSL